MIELAVGPTVDEVADELYGLPPGSFVEARQRRAAEVRLRGDAGGAGAILALRKPTAGAWMSNQLVRWWRPEVLAFVDLGRALRIATDRLDGADLWSLTDRRRWAESSLFQKANHLALEDRVVLNSASRRGLSDTLQAAICSAEMAQRMLTGRLAEPLTKISWPGISPAVFGNDLARRRAVRLIESGGLVVRDDDDDDDDDDGGACARGAFVRSSGSGLILGFWWLKPKAHRRGVGSGFALFLAFDVGFSVVAGWVVPSRAAVKDLENICRQDWTIRVV